MKLTTPALTVAFLLAACGGSPSSPATGATTPEGDGDHEVDTSEPAGIGVLKALDGGDTDCEVTIERDDGTPATLPGSFELCAGGSMDATAMIGTRVTYTTHEDKIIAASCQGDPACTESEQVDLVDSFAPAP